MGKQNLRKLTLAAVLTALSIVLDILFKSIVPANQSFGFPFYAIPLVVGSIVLGPIYGGMMGFISDAVGFFAGGSQFAYDFMFALQAISWGVIPYLIARRKSGWVRILLAVIVSHIMATSFSTLASFLSSYAYSSNLNSAITYATANLPLRLLMMPVNIIIISYVTFTVNTRLEPLYM
ncbi:folate family ECF transporter S component [Acholeplasma laidlawii]|uniref:folate family ECF transporter S component n=1 Tax=Acholeplasma laidlawii TaxID=2148 RepID=UPI00253FB126|nr:folate family ECF transporter S component [Acholeplasma laidlawii]